MIYVTGDTHRGELQRVFDYVDDNDLTEQDTLIILGDVGINFYMDSSDHYLEKRLGQLKPFIFCIKGNHECSLYENMGYKKTWSEHVKGPIWQRKEGIGFAIDGETYEIEGKSFIALGGAYSVDKHYRLQWEKYNPEKQTWFPEEQMTEQEKANAIEKLNDIDWKIDVVLSHTCPCSYIPTEWFLSTVDQSTVDNSMEEWLDEIEKKLDYKLWFCGHYHGEKEIDKIRFLYRSVINL